MNPSAPALILVTDTTTASVALPGTLLTTDWSSDMFLSSISNSSDCIQPLPDCTREGWIQTAVTGVRACPGRVCTVAALVLNTSLPIQCPANGQFPTTYYSLLVNPVSAPPVTSPYSQWTFPVAVVLLVLAWIVPLAIWTAFGSLNVHIWAELVIAAMMLGANDHTAPLALSLLQNLNQGVSSSFLFNCADTANLSILAWTGFVAMFVLEPRTSSRCSPTPNELTVLRGVLCLQRLLGGWLLFYLAPIALANIWSCGVGVGVRLFFPLAAAACHVGYRLFLRIPEQIRLLWFLLMLAVCAPLIVVAWVFALPSPGLCFGVGFGAAFLVYAPWAFNAYRWRERSKLHSILLPIGAATALIFGIVFLIGVYTGTPAAVILIFLFLWLTTIIVVTVAAAGLAVAAPTAAATGNPAAPRLPENSMTSRLLERNEEL